MFSRLCSQDPTTDSETTNLEFSWFLISTNLAKQTSNNEETILLKLFIIGQTMVKFRIRSVGICIVRFSEQDSIYQNELTKLGTF